MNVDKLIDAHTAKPTVQLTGGTRIFGVIADPVVQARTPALGNAILERRGLCARYVVLPMHVRALSLASCLAGLRGIENFCGAVVSMPHKVVATQFVDELTREARLVGALNVIRRDSSGHLKGTILDGEGFVRGLRSRGYEIRGSHVLLVGAGGVGRAIAFAVAKHGCASLTLANRTELKAVELARCVREAFPSVEVLVENRVRAGYDMGINATSLGMNAHDSLPLSPELIDSCQTIADCVVAPEMTLLLRTAAARGHQIHTGLPMLEAQLDMMLSFMEPAFG